MKRSSAGRSSLRPTLAKRWQLEEQLRQSQKREAGVAHDFNNLLTVIAGYATIWKMDLLGKKEQAEVIEQILAASDRAAHLTRGLRPAA